MITEAAASAAMSSRRRQLTFLGHVPSPVFCINEIQEQLIANRDAGAVDMDRRSGGETGDRPRQKCMERSREGAGRGEGDEAVLRAYVHRSGRRDDNVTARSRAQRLCSTRTKLRDLN